MQVLEFKKTKDLTHKNRVRETYLYEKDLKTLQPNPHEVILKKRISDLNLRSA